MQTVLSVIGTRPEAIKMAPVVQELVRRADRVRSVVCVTGQHREMLDQVLTSFGVTPDIELNAMQPDQRLSDVTALLFSRLGPAVDAVRPDWILAQGDTTTVMVASLVAYYDRVRFGHVEAGLRTGDLFQPFPEEGNRRIADATATLLFAPTEGSRRALLAEGIPDDRVLVTGNTVVDALQSMAECPYNWAAGPLKDVSRDRRIVLVTAHRRESFGGPFRELCLAIRDLGLRYGPDGTQFVYPVHLNPHVQQTVREILSDTPGVTLLEPLDYRSMVALLKRSTLVLTDSGGIQEEAPTFRVPVLVMRDVTERPEGIEAGVSRLVGRTRDGIVCEVARLLESAEARASMSNRSNPYGDGRAATRIVAALLDCDVHP